MGLTDFPPELLTRIFLRLSYKSLLCVEAVCVRWNAIVAKDPELSVQTFKKLSKVHVEPGCTEPGFPSGSGKFKFEASSEPVRLHPALDEASYCMGDSLESVRFYTKGDHQLCQLAIANDFISIPVVTMATLVFPDRIWGPGFKIKAENSKGVRLTDVFAALEKESNVPVYTQDYGIIKKGEALGDHRYYEGLQKVARTGLGLSAEIWLGS